MHELAEFTLNLLQLEVAQLKGSLWIAIYKKDSILALFKFC